MSSERDIAAWDRNAAAYAASAGGASDSFFQRLRPFLDDQFGDVRGRRVLDLGCGHGWLSALLVDAGAEVVGIDGSERLIEEARRRAPEATFVAHDMTTPFPPGLGTFDRVISHMVLMDLPDVTEALRAVRGALAPEGVFVASILHPSFWSHPIHEIEPGRWRRHVPGYLDHEEWTVRSFGGHVHYHRPLSWYVSELAARGLAVTALDEPALPVPDDGAGTVTAFDAWRARIPTMLSIACTHDVRADQLDSVVADRRIPTAVTRTTAAPASSDSARSTTALMP